MSCLSETKILAYRQCPKRLWLEIHRPALREDSAATEASFREGHEVGEIARQIYDPKGKWELIKCKETGIDAAIARTKELLALRNPIFKAGFATEDARAFADVLVSARKKGKLGWRMIEVKSSTEIKPCHRDDVAIQFHIAKSSGVPLTSISLAHIDNSWVYPGQKENQGLLVEHDLTEEAEEMGAEVQEWIQEAHQVARRRTAPKITTGPQCKEPNECGFLGYCESLEPQIKHPVTWLPNIRT